MPARLSSMELSDPANADPTIPNNATTRRKSARTRQKPVLLQEVPDVSNASNGSTKRKRADLRDRDSPDPLDDISDEETSLDESDGDPHEEELKEKRTKASRDRKAAPKPAAKKPKTVSAPTTKLAVRPAINGTNSAPKPKKPRARSNTVVSDSGTGLYCTWNSPVDLRYI